jgi:hypothetical protein
VTQTAPMVRAGLVTHLVQTAPSSRSHASSEACSTFEARLNMAGQGPASDTESG